jgi:hypothetical protein
MHLKERREGILAQTLGLLFRGSIHGWNFKDFHSRCDGQGPTISLFKVKDGDCIGGYTSA